MHVDVTQTLTGVDSSTFSDPAVQDAFRNAVASSVGNGVTADNVMVNSYTDVVSAAAMARLEKNAELTSAGLQEHISRELASGRLSVSYSILFNALQLGTVEAASTAVTSNLVAAITSGNFTKNLKAAAASAGITTVYWQAPTDISSLVIAVVYPPPTALPTAAPTAAPSSKSSKKVVDMALPLGVGIGVGVPVLILLVFMLYKFCGKSSSQSVAPASA